MFFEIEFTPKPSYILMGLMSFIHLFALCAISIAEISIMAKLFSFLFISGSVYYHWTILSGGHPTSIVSCSHRKEAWQLKDKSGKEYEAVLLNNKIVSRYCLILNFAIKLSNHKCSHHSLILCPDSISTDQFRKLSAILLLNR